MASHAARTSCWIPRGGLCLSRRMTSQVNSSKRSCACDVGFRNIFLHFHKFNVMAFDFRIPYPLCVILSTILKCTFWNVLTAGTGEYPDVYSNRIPCVELCVLCSIPKQWQLFDGHLSAAFNNSYKLKSVYGLSWRRTAHRMYYHKFGWFSARKINVQPCVKHNILFAVSRYSSVIIILVFFRAYLVELFHIVLDAGNRPFRRQEHFYTRLRAFRSVHYHRIPRYNFGRFKRPCYNIVKRSEFCGNSIAFSLRKRPVYTRTTTADGGPSAAQFGLP